MRQPPLQKSYVANVALVVLALFPGLINTSALSLLSPVVGSDLGIAPDAVGRLPLFNDAALAFGVLLAADLVRFFDARTIAYALVATSLATSVVSAFATTFPLLVIAHAIHGLASGALFIAMLPPLLTGFGSKRLGTSAAVLVPCLFGASTLGPIVAALVAGAHLWRTIFAGEAVLSLVTIALIALTLAPRPASEPDANPDWFAHVVSGCAATSIFIGAGRAVGNEWSDPSVALPIALGVALFITLFVGERIRPSALVPVRGLSTSLALVGILATMIGSECFAILTQANVLELERIHHFDIRATGFATWPEALAALGAGLLFGRLITTKWVALVGVLGLAILAAARCLTSGEIMLLY